MSDENQNPIEVKNKEPRKPITNVIYGVLKDREFVGITALAVLGGIALYFEQMEAAMAAVTGVAALFKRGSKED